MASMSSVICSRLTRQTSAQRFSSNSDRQRFGPNCEAQAEIAELKRQLFGSKADRLSPEQQGQIDALGRDLDEHLARPEPVGVEVLVEDEATARPRRPRRGRQDRK